MSYDKRFLRNKWKMPLVAILITVLLLSFVLFEILPGICGSMWITVTFRPLPETFTMPSEPARGWEVRLPNGWTGTVGWIAIEYNRTNSYFMPVRIHYNGFDFVMLVYNKTVEDPTDIVANREYFVWGAYYAPRRDPFVRLLKGAYFDYYASYRNSLNYTVTIPAGKACFLSFFDSPHNYPCWVGKDINDNMVPPGTYYIYFVYYGILARSSQNNITVIRWRLEDG